jgi:hypothetical protein
VDPEHPRVAAEGAGIARRAAEDLGPVVSEVLGVARADVVRERVIQLGVLEAALVRGGGQRKECLIPSGDVIYRRTGHLPGMLARLNRLNWRA